MLKLLNNDDTSNNFIIKKYKDYTIVKYKKNCITNENIDTIGLFRSVILKNNKIVCFSPPKSVSYNSFIENNEFNECKINYFVDGTMINMFYDRDVK